MFGCFSLSLSSPRMRSLVFVFFLARCVGNSRKWWNEIEWENGQLASLIWDVLAVWNELETNRGIWPTQEEALTNIKWEAYIKQATTMSTYWWEDPDKGWLWSMIFPWNVAGAPVEPAPTTNEELTHGTKPAPSFTVGEITSDDWTSFFTQCPMSLIFIGPVCQSPSMNFCPVQLAISWGKFPRLSAQMFR